MVELVICECTLVLIVPLVQHLQLTKALRRIFQKEKQLDEMRKELQGSESKKAKLQKQVHYQNALMS